MLLVHHGIHNYDVVYPNTGETIVQKYVSLQIQKTSKGDNHNYLIMSVNL
jgi:hypothetical protein